MATDLVSRNKAATLLNVESSRFYEMIDRGEVTTIVVDGRPMVSMAEVVRLREVVVPSRRFGHLVLDPDVVGEPVEVEEWMRHMRQTWAQRHHRTLPDGRVAIDATHI